MKSKIFVILALLTVALLVPSIVSAQVSGVPCVGSIICKFDFIEASGLWVLELPALDICFDIKVSTPSGAIPGEAAVVESSNELFRLIAAEIKGGPERKCFDASGTTSFRVNAGDIEENPGGNTALLSSLSIIDFEIIPEFSTYGIIAAIVAIGLGTAYIARRRKQ